MKLLFASLAAFLTVPVQAASVTGLYDKLPLSFEANRGQTDRRVKFLARGRRSTLFLTPSEAVLALDTRSLHFAFSGAAKMVGLEEQSAKSNYFTANDPARWRIDIPHFARVEYRELYPGVNLVFYGREQSLEYDFVVGPRADPKQIRMNVRGGDRMSLDAAGDLLIAVGAESVRMKRPIAYQERDGRRQPVEARFVLAGKRVSFAIGAYDATRPLIIDPVLAYSTYFGAGSDTGFGVAVDPAGNIYLAGSTQSTTFPTSNALQPSSVALESAFVAKLNPAGTALLYSTYLAGSSEDEARSIAVDGQGNAYVTGVTHSKDFPLQNPLQSKSPIGWTAFVTKISADGSRLVYSTFLGGSSIDEGWGIAVDPLGNAYVTGQTISKDFPTVNAVQPKPGSGPICINFCDDDAFVSMLSPDGSKLIYSTYLGGGDDDYGYGIAVDPIGNAYVVGQTASVNFPLAAAIQTGLRGRIDAFVARLSPGGKSLVYSTYLGGNADDSGRAIAVDQAGNVYVTGGTASTDFPTASPVQPNLGSGTNAFVSKLPPDGSSLIYSTYLGGSLPFASYINAGAIPDGGSGIAVDRYGNAYVTGAAASIDFPLVRPLDVSPPKGVVHSTDGGTTWSGGGTGFTGALAFGNSLQIDHQNPANLYLATQGGVFKSTDSGSHWSVTGLQTAINALAIDPQLPSILYAGTTTGFSKSSDGGATWTPDPTAGATLAVAVNPVNPALVYRAGLLSVLASTDRGATWHSIYANLPATQCGDSPSSCVSFAVTALAVDPTTSAVYASVKGSSIAPIPLPHLLYKLVGSAWTGVSAGLPSSPVTAIAVDPKNPNLVYAGLSAGLYRSTDGAATWKATTVTAPVNGLQIDPNTSTAYAAVVGGVMRSADGGVTWASTGLRNTTADALALDTSGSSTLYAVADSGSDAFVAEINSTGSALVYSTRLGGGSADNGSAIALDAAGNVFVTGTTSSADFPVAGALQGAFPAGVTRTLSGFAPQTAFASKISASCPAPEPSSQYSLPVGFYITQFTNAPGTSEGNWDSTIQVSQGVMTGGFSFGGGLQENGATPAYGAFTVTSAQNMSLLIQAAALSNAAPLAVQVRLLDANRNVVGSPMTGTGSLQFNAALTPGFYIVEVRSGAASPRGNLQATLNATAIVGGIDTGGFVAAGQVGYGAFYIPQAQDVTVQAVGASTGSWGAGCLQVQLVDANRNVVAPKS
jgi:hypothetical protein